MNAIKATKAVLLKSSVMCAVLCLSGLANAADQQESMDVSQLKFSMAIPEEDAYAAQLIAGDFEAVITAYETNQMSDKNSFEKSNRLCIAYLLADQAENSQTYCDSAVTLSRREMRRNRISDVSFYTQNVAMALTNRGVLLARAGNYTGAKRDFIAARKASRWITGPTDNLAYLEAKVERAIASL